MGEFSLIFEVLRKARARVRRLRLFGMPLLSDAVVALMARYLKECTAGEAPPPQRAPPLRLLDR